MILWKNSVGLGIYLTESECATCWIDGISAQMLFALLHVSKGNVQIEWQRRLRFTFQTLTVRHSFDVQSFQSCRTKLWKKLTSISNWSGFDRQRESFIFGAKFKLSQMCNCEMGIISLESLLSNAMNYGYKRFAWECIWINLKLFWALFYQTTSCVSPDISNHSGNLMMGQWISMRTK